MDFPAAQCARTVSLLFLMAVLLTAQAAADERSSSGRETLDAKVADALSVLAEKSPESVELLAKAEAVLVFPDVVKVGFGIGGEYGEGALQEGSETVAYYSISGASFGLQLGAQTKTQVILFMSRSALRKFRRSKGWEAGVDGRIALVQAGAGGSLDTTTSQAPIIGFVFTNRGLMYNLTLEGSKITPLD